MKSHADGSLKGHILCIDHSPARMHVPEGVKTTPGNLGPGPLSEGISISQSAHCKASLQSVNTCSDSRPLGQRDDNWRSALFLSRAAAGAHCMHVLLAVHSQGRSGTFGGLYTSVTVSRGLIMAVVRVVEVRDVRRDDLGVTEKEARVVISAI